MDNEYIKQLFPYLLLIGAMIIFGIISSVVSRRNNKVAKNNYLQKYPNAVRVYPKYTNVVVASSQITIHSVDGETPIYDKGAFLVKPGKSVLNVRFDSERVGFFYKRVRTYTDPVDVEVDLEAGKEYIISFDKKLDNFVVSEK